MQVSFETPEYTANADAIGTLRILEAIRILNLTKSIKFYQASTSEMYGSTPPPQNENSPMKPASPYPLLSFMHIGLQKIIEHLIICLHQQEFCLTMRVHQEERRL